MEIPKECYAETSHTGKILTCEAHGRKVIFLDLAGRPVDKIRIDRCVIHEKLACDYLVIDWANRHHFVELKGRHDGRALDQIAAVIPLFFPVGSKEKFWCFVIAVAALRPPTPPRKTRG